MNKIISDLRQLDESNKQHDKEIRDLNALKKENMRKTTALLAEHFHRKNGDIVTVDKKQWKIKGMFSQFDVFLDLSYVELCAYCWPVKKDGTVDERSDPNKTIKTIGRLKLSE